MRQIFISFLVQMLVVIALSFVYAFIAEKRHRRDREEAENLRQGFMKLGWDNIPPAPAGGDR